MEFIEFKDCTKIYKNGVTGIANANLKISKGEFVLSLVIQPVAKVL